jgi:HAD superfamily hydrolase (TIGR01662 family)
MPQAVLFDFEETLADFRPADPRELFQAGARRVYACLTALGCSLPNFEAFARQQRAISRRIDWTTWLTGGEPDARRMLRRLCRDYGLQRDEESIAKIGWLWYEPIAETAHLATDVLPTLSSLRNANIKLALVMNTPFQGIVVDRLLETLGLLEFFPVRAYSTDHASRKPNPELFAAALGELGVAAADSAFVGDDVATDMVGARRMGMQTILRSSEPSKRAQKLCDHVIERIGQLTDLFDLQPQRREVKMTLPPLNAAAR